MRLVYDENISRLDKRVTFRMTKEERDRLSRISTKLKMNNSDILRGLIDDEYNRIFSTKKRNWRKK